MSDASFNGGVEFEAGWRLEGQDGQGRPLRLSFGETALRRAHLGLTVGRHAALCELVIDDPSMSRRHFRLGVGAAGLFVEDVNSLNGTLIDGQALTPFQPVVLHEGQTLTAGAAVLAVQRLAGG